ncbi:hypothetical protein B0T11DRAFT_29431 [Plectosphaerella cucumerina]|uniref:Uncharacterized protein n=1 Tax=Plectosphaerella cucumerina TaxID=40658 RepID=A0A8K0X9P6_9PEZI|nr:hypothetical protein B0T11DRAFT_29431 [Plectosphaerella cucumerina]
MASPTRAPMPRPSRLPCFGLRVMEQGSCWRIWRAKMRPTHRTSSNICSCSSPGRASFMNQRSHHLPRKPPLPCRHPPRQWTSSARRTAPRAGGGSTNRRRRPVAQEKGRGGVWRKEDSRQVRRVMPSPAHRTSRPNAVTALSKAALRATPTVAWAVLTTLWQCWPQARFRTSFLLIRCWSTLTPWDSSLVSSRRVTRHASLTRSPDDWCCDAVSQDTQQHLPSPFPDFHAPDVASEQRDVRHGEDSTTSCLPDLGRVDSASRCFDAVDLADYDIRMELEARVRDLNAKVWDLAVLMGRWGNGRMVS